MTTLLQTISLTVLLVLQLQGLLVELREGLRAGLTDLSELRQRDHDLEEKLQAHQTDVDDKIMGLKNSLNTIKVEKRKLLPTFQLRPFLDFTHITLLNIFSRIVLLF